MENNVLSAQSEYDSFGPWAYEINDSYPLPRLFAPFFSADDKAILMIKIPRQIDRKDASPDMDLYDFVLALYEDKLRILERKGNEVADHLIPAESFMGIRIYEKLLMAGCTVFSDNESVSFPFNSTSMALIRKFADLSIEKLQDKGPAGHTVDVSSLPVSGETPDSILLTNLLHEEQVKTEGIAVGAKQAGIPINRRTDTRSDIERMLWKELNPEALYLYTAKDLIILELGSFPNRGGTTELGYTYTILPFNRITGMEITDSKTYKDLKKCVLSLGQNRITYHFAQDNAQVAAFYNALK